MLGWTTNVAATALLLLAGCAAAPAGTPEGGPRVVAVGDLHGDLDNAVAALQLGGITDAQGRWTGGDAILVQTGDVTDRGPESRAVLDLVRRLSSEAQSAGGRVVALLGNHEVMNLQGDLRYVHPGDIEAFGGAAARAAAFAPTGEYGAWLATLDAVALVDGTVFAHGGVAPRWAAKGIDAINAEVHAGLFQRGSEATGPDGPLWLRELVEAPESAACAAVGDSLAALGARRMVVGHTTRRDGRIASRCAGRLQVIDVGISDHYGGHLAVWEQISEDARALYPSGPVDLEDPS